MSLIGCTEIRPKPDEWRNDNYEVVYNSKTGESRLYYTSPKSGHKSEVLDFRLEKLGVNETHIKIACSDYNSIYYFHIKKQNGALGDLSPALTGDELEEAEKSLALPEFTWRTK